MPALVAMFVAKLTYADVEIFTVGQDGNGPSAPISETTQSLGTTTAVYVLLGTLNSLSQSLIISANAQGAQAFGIYALGSNVNIGTISANISTSAPNGTSSAIMIDSANANITLLSGTISASGLQESYGIYATGSLTVYLPASSYAPIEGDIYAVNLTTSGSGIFTPSDCTLYIQDTLNLGSSLVFGGLDKSEVRAKSIVIQNSNELWLQGTGTRNVYTNSISGGVLYGYNLVLNPYNAGSAISIENLTVDATSLNVNADVEINGSMDFRYSTNVNFAGNFLGGNVSFGNVTRFYTGPIVINFAKQFSPNGIANTGSAAFDKVTANFSGGLLMSAQSANNYDVLSFSNNALASLNNSTLTFDFSNYATGGKVGIDFFEGLANGTISDIAAIEVIGASSELDESQIISAITNGTFSSATVIFEIPFTAAKIPFQTSLAARESLELIFSQHLDTIFSSSNFKDNQWYFSVKNINRFAADSDSWRQSFGAQAYAQRGFGGRTSLSILAGGFNSESGDEFHNAKFDTLSLSLSANLEIFENLDAFLSTNYSRGFCDGKRFAPDAAYYGSWNSNTLGVLAGLRAPFAITQELTISPILATSFANLWNLEMDENGGASPMQSAPYSYSSLRLIAGLETQYRIGENLFISVRGLWSRETMDSAYGVFAGYLESQNSAQYFAGKHIAKNSAILGVELRWKVWQQVEISLDYAAQVRGSILSNNIFAGIGIEF